MVRCFSHSLHRPSRRFTEPHEMRDRRECPDVHLPNKGYSLAGPSPCGLCRIRWLSLVINRWSFKKFSSCATCCRFPSCSGCLLGVPGRLVASHFQPLFRIAAQNMKTDFHYKVFGRGTTAAKREGFPITCSIQPSTLLNLVQYAEEDEAPRLLEPPITE